MAGIGRGSLNMVLHGVWGGGRDWNDNLRNRKYDVYQGLVHPVIS